MIAEMVSYAALEQQKSVSFRALATLRSWEHRAFEGLFASQLEFADSSRNLPERCGASADAQRTGPAARSVPMPTSEVDERLLKKGVAKAFPQALEAGIAESRPVLGQILRPIGEPIANSEKHSKVWAKQSQSGVLLVGRTAQRGEAALLITVIQRASSLQIYMRNYDMQEQEIFALLDRMKAELEWVGMALDGLVVNGKSIWTIRSV